MARKKKPAKEISRKVVYESDSGDIRLSQVFEIDRPPPDKDKDKDSKPHS